MKRLYNAPIFALCSAKLIQLRDRHPKFMITESFTHDFRHLIELLFISIRFFEYA